METGHELALGLRQIEGIAVRFGDTGDEKDEESQNLRDDVPDVSRALGLDDVDERHRAGQHQGANDRQTLRNLVGDHLRRRSQPSHERELRVRRPAADDDAVHTERRHGDDEEGADVEIGNEVAQ